ncbi:MAG: immunoglobulin domain-containing protein, partial [Verrucomicrobiota bacterium]
EGKLWDVVYGNDRWIAVGDGGAVMVSSNGMDWEAQPSGTTQSLRSIAYANGLWVATGVEGTALWSDNGTDWNSANLPDFSDTPQRPFLHSVSHHEGDWVTVGGFGTILRSADGKTWEPAAHFIYPTAAYVFDVAKPLDNRWFIGGHSVTETGVLFSAGADDLPAREEPSRFFSSEESFTVQDTDAPEAFGRILLDRDWGTGEETLYLAFQIKRESALGALDFTGLQLSNSLTNLPATGDIGFGNSGPLRNFSFFVERVGIRQASDTPMPVDNETHLIMARIDYQSSQVSMVVDPATIDEIEQATRHSAPTNAFSSILLRAGHNNTSYTYSRIALGQDPEDVFEFASNQPSEPPQIVVQPESVTGIEGNDLSLSVEASGSGELSYQWYREETVLEGATMPLLLLEGAGPAVMGTYSVEVNNEVGSIRSETVMVTVIGVPVIGPYDESLMGSPGEELVLTVELSGESLSYQWQKDGQDLPGATGARLVIPELSETDAGTYRLVVSNPAGTVTSDPIMVTLFDPLAHFPKPGEWRSLLTDLTPNFLNGVGYGNGLWVATGDFGYIATSSDGIRWQPQESSAPVNWSADEPVGDGITQPLYSGGRWVAPSTMGNVYTSEDGLEWQHTPVAEGVSLDECAYGDGVWLVAGEGGGVYRSTDGLAWTPVAVPDSD